MILVAGAKFTFGPSFFAAFTELRLQMLTVDVDLSPYAYVT
jgi:hypothetical protein